MISKTVKVNLLVDEVETDICSMICFLLFTPKSLFFIGKAEYNRDPLF